MVDLGGGAPFTQEARNDMAERAANDLSIDINNHCGVYIAPKLIAHYLQHRWLIVSQLAHIIHNGRDVQTPDPNRTWP